MRSYGLLSSLTLASAVAAAAPASGVDQDIATTAAEDPGVVATGRLAVPAQAAALAASCEIHIGVTSQSGNTITGYGSQANCGTQGVSYLTIQRSRWYGWQDLTTANVVGSGHDVYVRYNCAGTGTHDFRTIHTGRTIGGRPLFKESNHIRATCR